ncbi:hypothetical protein PQO03_06590 [Lentisphaera profundi]|uniref:Beta-glucanase n=1 Tax=Lentisphaera profundi TaxID=1658616 RepID=A0ABY7VTB6_9BACT|nr:hypothetical protein [Lentisphaera profundi]WDE95383.1 hypothetical protein PQO03_06590 [Lentisphaera profundi]
MKKMIMTMFAIFAMLTVNAQDFGDHSSSTLTSKAWEALSSGDHAKVMSYTNKCIEMYLAKAKEMQSGLTAMPTGSQEEVSKFWALNDVGTCFFIQGQSLQKNGEKSAASKAFKTLVDELKYAQCWDTNGWFWSPAGAAKKTLVELEFETSI